MPSSQLRRLWLIGVVLALGLVYVVLGWNRLARQEEALQRAHAELDEVRQKLRAVAEIDRAPRIASVSIESPAETTTRISEALQIAGLPISALLRQEPATARRIERSDFELRQTTIELAPASLPQLAQFAAALHDDETGSMVSRIQLTAPNRRSGGAPAPSRARANRENASNEQWKAEMTLTQVIYSPESSQAAAVRRTDSSQGPR